jgi:hypothetical protein
MQQAEQTKFQLDHAAKMQQNDQMHQQTLQQLAAQPIKPTGAI